MARGNTDQTDTHGGVLIDKVHSLVQENVALHADVRALLGQVARRDETIFKLRQRVIFAAGGNAVVCRRCAEEIAEQPRVVEGSSVP